MSVNRYQPHILVIPEDDANRQLANGFVLGVPHQRRIQILPEVGGWQNVCRTLNAEHLLGMRKYAQRHIILLLDFDNHDERVNDVIKEIPEDLRSRVFVLGVQSEPEKLKQAGLGSLENIGKTLAIECFEGHRRVWKHDLLRQNDSQLTLLEQVVRGFLFENA